MKLEQLSKTTTRKHKRLGQGYGSGKGGHTSSRGQKGQRTRNDIAEWFEGGQLPQIRRFPFIRGKSRFQSLKPATIEINLNALNKFPKNSVIDVKALSDAGLIKASELQSKQIKILGTGEVTVPLTLKVPSSKSAAAKIEAAGGKVSRGENS